MCSIPFITFIREIGYGGVDILFLLSGIGVFFSLQKNDSPLTFMKRRAWRILPSYYPFILLWLIMIKITGELYGTEIIGNLTMAGWWCNLRNQFNWYTNAIWLFYLSAPLLVKSIHSAWDTHKSVCHSSHSYSYTVRHLFQHFFNYMKCLSFLFAPLDKIEIFYLTMIIT